VMAAWASADSKSYMAEYWPCCQAAKYALAASSGRLGTGVAVGGGDVGSAVGGGGGSGAPQALSRSVRTIRT
jgi:hypothetical protein